MRWLSLLLLTACDPYAGWPEMRDVFPWGVTDDQALEPYEEVRWEEGPWAPETQGELNALYLQKAVFHRPGTPSDALYHWGLMRGQIPTLQRDQLVLSFVGDILDTGDPPVDFSRVADRLDGDLRIGNLETPVAPGVDVGDGRIGVPLFNAPSSLLDGLPLDLVQVVNNHSLDAGDAGLEQTLAELEARGIVGVGVDGTIVTADLGDGNLLAIVAYTWGMNDPDATSAYDLGIVPFGEPGEPDLSRVEADLAALRDAGVSLTVVLVHWGYEYEYYPDPHFLRLGRRLVVAGADLVVGHGSHTAQPAEWCTVNIPASRPGVGSCSLRTADGTPRYAGIFYGLGNFGTDQPGIPLQVGLIGHVNLAPGIGVFGMQWDAVASVPGEERQQLVPLDELLDDEEYAAESTRLDQHVGASFRRR